MIGWILDYITDKQIEGAIRIEQEDRSAWFKNPLHFTVDITPETEVIFKDLSVAESIKLVRDYEMPPFDEEKHAHKDPAARNELREYHNFDFGIAILTEKTDLKLGYLPMPVNVYPPDIYRRGTWKQAVHKLMREEEKVHAKLIRLERVDKSGRPLSIFGQASVPYLNGFFRLALFINTDLDQLNKNAKEWVLRQEKLSKTSDESHGTLSAILEEENDESLSHESVWDEYDEDGIPYEDYEK